MTFKLKSDRVLRIVVTHILGALAFLATLASFAMIGLLVVGLV